jgi:alkylation response protein AidB-like acyl-CoA dehydrogenase
MDLMPSDDQLEIAATVAAFLADRLPVTGRGSHHVVSGPEIDPEIWRTCAGLGWLALGLGEEHGGVGFGPAEEIMLFRELGRGVAPGPFLPGVLAAHLAACVGDAALTESITSGVAKVALGTPVRPASIGAIVDAEVSVVHTDGAEFVLVAGAGAAALVPAAACGIAPIDPVAGSTTTGRGRIEGVDAVAWADAGACPVYDRGLVLAAASATGVAEAALALAVGYAGQRVQFGKPIGVNQAIKHRCADMAVAADGAFAQVCYSALAVGDRMPGSSVEAAIAKYAADEAARIACEGAVQIHGAMGFTSEATPHRYVYRAHLLARCLASRAALLDRIVGDR